MNPELRDLYQEVILDHSRRPRNFRRPPRADLTAEGYNPLCGDQITLYLDVEGDVITDAGFEGAGCAISVASASMMTAALKGRTKAEAEAFFRAFHGLVTGDAGGGADGVDLGKLAVFGGVSEFPVRVKCATLPWHTMHAALEGGGQTVSTE